MAVSFVKLVQSSLFAFPDGLLPVNVGVPLTLPSSLPFPSPFEFRCGEAVGKGERGRPFDLPFLFGSCLNAHASPNEQWPFRGPTNAVSALGLVFGILIAFFLCSELLLQVCPRLAFSLLNEDPRFSARDVVGPSTSICNNHTLCRQVSSLERSLATHISILPTLQLASCTDCPRCRRYVRQ